MEGGGKTFLQPRLIVGPVRRRNRFHWRRTGRTSRLLPLSAQPGAAHHPLPRGGLSMHGVAVLGFLVAVAPITTTPGTSLTLVVSGVATGGRSQVW
jgi:hypothetical protein